MAPNAPPPPPGCGAAAPAAPSCAVCGASLAAAGPGACRRPPCVARRQMPHFGTLPWKLGAQGNAAPHSAHSRRGIAPARCWRAWWGECSRDSKRRGRELFFCGDFCDGRVTNAGGVNPRTVSKECDCVSLLGPLGEPAIVAIQAAANDARAATAEIHGLLRGGTLDADYSGISAARRMDIEPTSEGGQWSGREKGRSASHMGEFARVRPACIVTQCDWSCLIACAGLASPSRSVQSFGPGPHFSRTACNWVPCYRHHPHFCRCAGVIAST